MDRITSITEISGQPNFQGGELHGWAPSTRISAMPKKAAGPKEPKKIAAPKKRRGPYKTGAAEKPPPPFYQENCIRGWRVYRKMTIGDLAEAADMSPGNLSELERGEQGYSPEGLANLARVLKTTPGALLDFDPTRGQAGYLWEMWNNANEQQRIDLHSVAKTLLKPSKSSG